MAEETKQIVILVACGLDDEKTSVAWSVASGAIKSGLEVTMFLTAAAVDSVRKGAAEKVHLNPLDPPLGEMMNFVTSSGGKILVCPPCAKVRGYDESDLIDGVVVTGSGAMHELLKKGAATLCF